MGLLKTLGLEKTLPADLVTDSTSIKNAGPGLGLGKDALKAAQAAADTVAKNLASLQSRVEPRLYDMKRAEFESIATRLKQRKAGDAAIATDLAELQVLAAETTVAGKDNKANRKTLEAAQKGFAAALVARLDKSGGQGTPAELANDLKGYFDGLVAGGSTARLGAALRVLDTLKGSDDDRLKKAAKEMTAMLQSEAQARQKAMGASDAKRDVARTPNDVLVHLMSAVADALKKFPKDVKLEAAAKKGKKMFMTHEFDRASVASLIAEAKAALEGLGEAGSAALCDKLEGQLPKVDKDTGDVDKVERTQAQDNIYGRVFDSKMVHALVKAPPQEMLDASAKSSKAFADSLADGADNEKAAAKLRKDYVIGDVRSWSKQIKAFDDIANAKTDTEALAELKKFLGTPPTSGVEVIAQTFLMAKMSIEQQNTGNQPDFMAKAGKNYGDVIQKQAVRERGASGQKVISEGAGITLLHQPSAVEDDKLVSSERPITFNRFGARKGGMGKDDKDASQIELSEVTNLQHEKSLPFASGVSGSTNILLHLYESLQASGLKGVGAREFLMNSMLFLVYDGGHSMHEVMWTANQLDKQLGLGLNLGNPDKPNEFVSDYDTLIDGFGDSMKASMQGAMDEAWDGTQDYLKKNSFFAQ